MADDGMARIRVRRGSDRLSGGYVRYKIIIDGETCAHLSRDSSAECEVAPGVHTIRARQAWLRSEKIPVDAQPGQVIDFDLVFKHGWYWWPMTIARPTDLFSLVRRPDAT
jgi:hypothetical protein